MKLKKRSSRGKKEFSAARVDEAKVEKDAATIEAKAKVNTAKSLIAE